ncbi:MAG: flippase-like domain-containing protein [Magnetococcus sp. YQC-5]
MQTIWRWVMPLLKMVFAFGLVGYLWYQGKLDFSALGVMTSAPWTMLAVVILHMLAYSTVAFRWVLLLHSQKIDLPFSWGHRVTYIGFFFNLVLPGGGLAGDALRMAYAIRSAPSHRPEAILSLFVDRAIGMYVMLFICLLAVLANPALVFEIGPLRYMALGVLLMVVGGPPLAFLLYQIARRNTLLRSFLFAPNPGRINRLILRFVQIIRLYRDSSPQLLQAAALSLLSQTMLLIALLMVATTMGLGSLGAGDYAFATPWAWMANFIPLTPGGIGVGEATFDQICRWIETSPTGAAYGTIFLVFRILGMLGTFPGLIAYLFSRQDVIQAIKENPV